MGRKELSSSFWSQSPSLGIFWSRLGSKLPPGRRSRASCKALESARAAVSRGIRTASNTGGFSPKVTSVRSLNCSSTFHVKLLSGLVLQVNSRLLGLLRARFEGRETVVSQQTKYHAQEIEPHNACIIYNYIFYLYIHNTYCIHILYLYPMPRDKSCHQ